MTDQWEDRELINLPPDLIRALGVVSARYGQSEHLFTMTIHRAKGILIVDAFAEAKRLRYSDKIREEAKRSFRKWATDRYKEPEAKQRIENFTKLIRDWSRKKTGLAAYRDDVIHCHWSIDDDRMVTGTRKDKLLKWDGKQVVTEDVQALADDLTNFVLYLNRATRPDQERALGALGTTYTRGAPVFDLPTFATAAASELKFIPFGKPTGD